MTSRVQRRGCITIATRKTAYAEMAVDLALSVKALHAESMCLVADRDNAAYVATHYPAVFDSVVELPARYHFGHACKFALADLTPYEQTLFIDADTLVLSSITHLWSHAEGVPLQMMGTLRTRDTDELHHGFAIRELIDEFALERYFDNHSGAFVFRREAAPFLEACFDVYANALFTPRRRLRGFVGDELAFGIVGGRRGVARMREPYPVLWDAELAALRPYETSKPLCHFIGSPSSAALDWLMDDMRRRRAERGLPQRSEAAWRRKASRTLRKRRVGAKLLHLRSLVSDSWGRVFG